MSREIGAVEELFEALFHAEPRDVAELECFSALTSAVWEDIFQDWLDRVLSEAS